MTTVLSARGLEFSHETTAVLKGVDLDVCSGETIALLGRNGAGKSTLFRLLAASWRPGAGSVTLHGEPYAYNRKGRDRVRRAVQLVLQEPDDQIFATTVRADVSYGPVNQGLTEAEVSERVEAALAATGITHLAERVPHHLSFGQRKRVVLAGALAMRPEVLLLDEPTAGLDPTGTREVAASIEKLTNAGTAVVLCTHDVNFAYAVSRTAAILVDGSLVSGPTRDILADHVLMERAGLEVPWAPLVSRALGREVTDTRDLHDR
ncbi:cobalt transport system ATP binding protein [Corynebacterium vitaeruminis DSM 20294]|uniref:ABC transporter ATP-binding protein n=1 Tax=Corynebacterium vitaeruminis DSM 20294 TaxID=1224164 RepID=W5XYV4_9CORY|nr:cobalt transport system ATP binding protein [Corynebacterium vitaeruminis DSM 20294]